MKTLPNIFIVYVVLRYLEFYIHFVSLILLLLMNTKVKGFAIFWYSSATYVFADVVKVTKHTKL